jgi:phospholipid/cholesterol/gamma-HCH transport system substrate-binding protein
MSHSRRNAHRAKPPVLFGVAMLAVAVAITYLGFTKHLPWAADWEVKAVFTSANELHAGSPVRIAGVNVGKVKKVERGPGGTALVTMSVSDEGRPLHKDTTMKVRPRIFLEGNFFVDVRPGTPSSPNLGDGDTVPLGQTAVPVQMDQILATLNTTTRSQLKVTLRELATAVDGGGARSLNRSFPDWEGAFKGTAIVFEALRGEREDDLSTLVSNQATIATAVSDRREQLRELIPSLDRTVTALASRQGEVGASLRGLAALLQVSEPALGEINRTFPILRTTTAEVRPALREAPETLTLALPLLRQLRGLVAPAEVPALVADLRPALRGLSSLEPGLTTLLRNVTPVTECVRRNALPTLKKPVPDGSLTNGQPAWLELLHSMVGLSSAGQNFDGNGYSVRYNGGYGEQLFSTGALPGVGKLYGLSPEPILGSRPKWPGPGKQPPFRPDVPCTTQALPNLVAQSTAAPPARRGSLAPLSPTARRWFSRTQARGAGR